jgi:hypothetical protein
MSAIDTVLGRVDRVRQVKPNQWMAACPCCQSRKGRPLSITEGSEGRALMHAFCGCQTDAVLSALGLTVNDLFDRPLAHHASPQRPNVSARDVLAGLTEEVTFVALIATDVLERRTISDEDWQRLAAAASRLGAARDYLR